MVTWLLCYSSLIVWRERKQFGVAGGARRRQGKHFAFSVLARNSFILIQTNYTWIVLFEIMDPLSSLAMISNLVWHSVYTHSRGSLIIADLKAQNLLEHVCLQGGFVTLGTRKWALSHLLHEAWLRVRTAWVPHFPPFFRIYLFLPNIRLLKDKDRKVVSIMGTSSANNKTSSKGCFIDSMVHHGSDRVFIKPIQSALLSNQSCIRLHFNRNQWMPNPSITSDLKTYPTKLNTDLLTVICIHNPVVKFPLPFHSPSTPELHPRKS